MREERIEMISELKQDIIDIRKAGHWEFKRRGIRIINFLIRFISNLCLIIKEVENEKKK